MADTIVIETPVATVLEVSGLQGPQGPAGASQADVLTTQGDLLYRGASAAQRLGIGSAGQVLKVSGGIPAWQNESGGVPTNRTIYAGTGLTGGGDLSANRTLAVTYGTTAGTACEGNDGRIAGIESGSTTISSATVEIGNAGISIATADGTGELHTGDGGSISTNDGGGSIDTSNGGGAINTRGTGSIEFGIAGTRTTLTGTATADRAISLPDAAGTLALTSDITKSAVGLGNVTNNAQVTSVSGTAPIVSSGGTTPAISISAASTSAAGSMSAADKTKLDGIAASANNYTHPNHTGDVTSVGDGATTIAANAVTNAKLAQIATSTIKGRATSGTGNVEDLSSAQVLTILGLLGAIKDMKIVSPSSDVTATNSTTLSNVSGMSFTVAANTTYLILTNLQVNCGSGGYNCEISFPSILNNGTTASGFGVQLPGNNVVAGLSATTATTVRVSNRGAAQTTPSFSILLVRTDSTGGTANFQWAQNQLSSPTSTILTSTRALIIPLTT